MHVEAMSLLLYLCTGEASSLIVRFKIFVKIRKSRMGADMQFRDITKTIFAKIIPKTEPTTITALHVSVVWGINSALRNLYCIKNK